MALSLFGRDPLFGALSEFGFPAMSTGLDQLARMSDEGFRSLAIDVKESDTGFTVASDLPGYNKEDVKITVQDGVLSIAAERKQEEETKNDKEWRRERFYGSVRRSVRLPETADQNDVSADFTNGVLKVTVGKLAIKDAAAPRTIAITGGGGAGAGASS